MVNDLLRKPWRGVFAAALVCTVLAGSGSAAAQTAPDALIDEHNQLAQEAAALRQRQAAGNNAGSPCGMSLLGVTYQGGISPASVAFRRASSAIDDKMAPFRTQATQAQ